MSKLARGYTLLELLIFMALSGIFLAVSAQLLQSAIDFKLESSGSSAVDMSGNYLFTRLKYDLRRATAVTTPAQINQPGSSLVLQIGGQSYTYSVTSGRLVLSTPSSTYPISDDTVTVQNFTVTRTGQSPQSTGVQITFDLESVSQTTGNITQSRSWQFSSVLR